MPHHAWATGVPHGAVGGMALAHLQPHTPHRLLDQAAELQGPWQESATTLNTVAIDAGAVCSVWRGSRVRPVCPGPQMVGFLNSLFRQPKEAPPPTIGCASSQGGGAASQSLHSETNVRDAHALAAKTEPAGTAAASPVAAVVDAPSQPLAPPIVHHNNVHGASSASFLPLNGPLDGYCVSVELAPAGSLSGGNGLAGTYNLLAPMPGAAPGGGQLQAQLAHQIMAFATQQASLLQQALPFMLNLPPARVTDKLRDLLTEVHARPALEKLIKATGGTEPMAQRCCLEYINRHGRGRVDPNRMLQFYHEHKDAIDFNRWALHGLRCALVHAHAVCTCGLPCEPPCACGLPMNAHGPTQRAAPALRQ